MGKQTFSKTEIRFLVGMGSTLALRQLGLIMVMPFLAIYGQQLTHSTPGLIGLSLGIYGLAQAIFQIPFGSWSDKYGRKPVILLGLFIFILGLILGYLARNIYVFILARTLQGSGAIMAVAYAWVGDNIRSEHRNQGMSIIGMLVGMSATLGFIAGPILYRWLDVPQLFLLCAFLSLMAWIYIFTFLKEEKRDLPVSHQHKATFLSHFKDRNLLYLVSGGFITNFVLVSQFYIVPLLLEPSLGVHGLWKAFVPATLLAIFVMRLAAKQADAGRFVLVATMAFAIIALGSLSYFTTQPLLVSLGLMLFMIGYMCLVTLLPAHVTKLSPKKYRGTITGIFNTCQFVGSFLGGSLTGLLWGIGPVYAILLLFIISAAGAVIIRKTTSQPDVAQ